MNRASLLVGVVIAAVLAAGCEDDKARKDMPGAMTATTPPRAATPPGAATPTAATVTMTTTTTVVIHLADIPTVADFEEEAERTITLANLETELARIEKEIIDDERRLPAPTEGAAPGGAATGTHGDAGADAGTHR